MGQGSDVVEHGKVDRFRLTNSGEGSCDFAALWPDAPWRACHLGIGLSRNQVCDRAVARAPKRPKTREYTYSVSLALAVCEGEITRIGRVWADGEEVAVSDLNMRVYTGSADQLPDPVMEAIEGQGNVPAYRGTAYVVMENLLLAALWQPCAAVFL